MKRLLTFLTMISVMLIPVTAQALHGTLESEPPVATDSITRMVKITVTASPSGNYDTRLTEHSINGTICKYEVLRDPSCTGGPAPATTMDIRLWNSRGIQLMSWSNVSANRKDVPDADSDGSIYDHEANFGPIRVGVKQMGVANSVVQILIFYQR